EPTTGPGGSAAQQGAQGPGQLQAQRAGQTDADDPVDAVQRLQLPAAYRQPQSSGRARPEPGPDAALLDGAALYATHGSFAAEAAGAQGQPGRTGGHGALCRLRGQGLRGSVRPCLVAPGLPRRLARGGHAQGSMEEAAAVCGAG